MKLSATNEKVVIKWYAVDTNGNKHRNNRGFISEGWDATCSCGWETKTGGAIKASVLADVRLHKMFAHRYTFKTSEEIANA